MRWLIAAAAASLWSVPLMAQRDQSETPNTSLPHDHSQQLPVDATPAPAPEEHSEHADETVAAESLAEPSTDGANAHATHDESTPQAQAEEEIGSTPAPAVPTDHAADAIFGSTEMSQAREAIRHEHGGFSNAMIRLNLAEYQLRKRANVLRWEGDAWFGGDINRLVVKSEGESSTRGDLEEAEFQLLYGRAISPYFNLEAGIRYDVKPDPSRGYAVVGIEGIAPYWFEVGAQIFLSDQGKLLARLEGSNDQRITQKLVFELRSELNFAAQTIAKDAIGSGLNDIEIGARLRYEFKKEFAPYIGVEWVRKVGETGRFARAAGDDDDAVSLVAGLRIWF